jgi:cold shock protein
LHNGTVAGYIPFNGRRAVGNVSRAASVQVIAPGNEQMAEGSIKRLTDRGFGFIATGGEKDLFFHSSSVQGVSFDELREGQRVSYTEGRGPKGPCAENVKPA